MRTATRRPRWTTSPQTVNRAACKPRRKNNGGTALAQPRRCFSATKKLGGGERVADDGAVVEHRAVAVLPICQRLVGAAAPDHAGAPDHAEAAVVTGTPDHRAAPEHGRRVHEHAGSPYHRRSP